MTLLFCGAALRWRQNTTARGAYSLEPMTYIYKADIPLYSHRPALRIFYAMPCF